MRIVHLIPQLRFGAGRYVVDLAARQACVSGGDQVVVLASADAEPPYQSDSRQIEALRGHGVRVAAAGDFFHRTVRGLTDAARQVARAAGVGRPWLAHAHTAMAAAVARIAGAHAVVGTCHGVAQDRPEAMDLQDALAWQVCDAVTSPSRHWAARLTDGFAVDRPLVMPYGLNLATYPRRERQARGDSQPIRLVTVAEQTHRKGLDVLLDAMPAVWAVAPTVECHLLGEGDAAASLRAHAARVDDTGRRVVFHGHQPGPYERLGAFDIFVLPSRSDNQPIAAIEAMLAALPVIASDVGGLGELVRDGACGWTVAPGDPSALSTAITAAVRAADSSRLELGTRGEAFARHQFDVTSAVSAMADLYERVWTARQR